MIKIYPILSLFLTSFLIPVTSVLSQDTDDIYNIIFSNDFEDNTVGLYDYNEWLGDWNMGWDAWWINRDITYIEQKDTSKAMKWIFPEGTLNGVDQGGKFHPEIPGLGAGYTELYFSYNIMFKPDFDFVISGKIPSMGGGEDWDDHGGAPYYDEGFRCGLAWSETWDGEGGLRFYIYHHDQSGPYGDTRNWSDPSTTDIYKFPTDEENWVNITIRIVLNTVNAPPENGNNDGFVEGFINGRLMERWEGLRFRNLPSIGIDYMKIYAQFGGVDPIFQTTRDEWILTDDYYLFTYANHVDVPRGHTPSPVGRVLQLPNMEKINAQNEDKPDEEAPAIPQGLTASNITNSSIDIQWNASTDNVAVSGYNIYLNDTKLGSSEDTFYSITGLNTETNYKIAVSAFDEAGNESAKSDVIQIVLTSIAPVKPTSLEALEFNEEFVSLAWVDNSDNEVGFQIQRADESMNFQHLAYLDANRESFINSNVVPGTEYHYRIRAFNTHGNSAFSNAIQVNIPMEGVSPNAPSEFIGSNDYYKKVNLSWNDNSFSESGFQLQRADSSFQFFVIDSLNPNTSFYTDSINLIPLETYFYRLRAFNDYGFSEFSDTLSFTIFDLELPDSPSLLNVSEIGYTEIKIFWQDNSSNESGFVIKRAPYPTEDFDAIMSISENSSSYVDNQIIPGETYYYVVNAVNEKGESENSNKIRITSLSLNDSLRVDSGLIVQYNFSLLYDSIIVDRSRFGTPLDLILKNADGANLKNSGKLEIKSNTSIQSQEIASKIIDACKLTNEISVECWLKSRVSLDFIPLKIIALQNDSAQGFALSCFSDETDPDKIKYATNLTTTTTDKHGNPLFTMDFATDPEVLQHVIFTHSNSGDERIYLNGQEVSSSYRPANYNNWMDNYTLVFGNGDDDNLPWLGDLYLCSFYNRALSVEEIQINYLASPFSNLDYMLNSHTYEIVAFPNPSNGILNISILDSIHQTDITEKYFIRIVDLMGHTIYNQDVTGKIDDESFELNVSFLNNGVYSLILFNQHSLIDAYKLLINH
ncbi:hypothetical protein ES705_03562 [subsurface metagenome]